MARVENTLSFTVDQSNPSQTVELGYRDEKPPVANNRRLHHQAPSWALLQSSEDKGSGISKDQEGLLIGVFDRYSLGDLLMPHVVSRLLDLSRLRCGSLLRSDFTSEGAYPVRNYGESAAEMVGKDLQLIHVGGETLSRSLTSGYASAIRGEEAERFESLLQIEDSASLKRFVSDRTGQPGDFAHVLSSSGEFYGSQSCFHAVGLADPDALSDEMQVRLVEIVKDADFVGIRDENGAAFLEDRGVTVERMPCGLSVLPLVCGRQHNEARDSASMREVKRRFPNGWISVETSRIDSEDFDMIVAALGSIAEKERVGLVFFEATDSREINLQEWVAAFRENKAMTFTSRNIWEASSLIMHSRLYCGSSLHCRIIAMSAGIPRINVPTGRAIVKSYCKLWEHESMSAELCRSDGDWAGQLRTAMKADFGRLKQHSVTLQGKYFAALRKLCQKTGMTAKATVPGRSVMTTDHLRSNQSGKETADEWTGDKENRQLFRRISQRQNQRNNGGRAIVQRAIRRTLGRVKL